MQLYYLKLTIKYSSPLAAVTKAKVQSNKDLRPYGHYKPKACTLHQIIGSDLTGILGRRIIGLLSNFQGIPQTCGYNFDTPPILFLFSCSNSLTASQSRALQSLSHYQMYLCFVVVICSLLVISRS